MDEPLDNLVAPDKLVDSINEINEGGEEEETDYGPWKETNVTDQQDCEKARNIKLVFMVMAIQLILVYFLVKLFSPDFIDKSSNLLDPSIALSRYLTGILLHYAMTDNIRHGLIMMKFAINHPWKFSHPHTAILCGFINVAVNFIVELLNFNLLMTSDDVLNCIWNFLGLNAIIGLGGYVYKTIQQSTEKDRVTNKAFLTKLFTVQTTTSEMAKAEIKEHELAPDGICPDEVKDQYPKYIRISFWDRTCTNKLEYIIYVIIKAGFVSIWYYFAPLAVVMLSYILAAYNAYKYGAVLDLKNTTW